MRIWQHCHLIIISRVPESVIIHSEISSHTKTTLIISGAMNMQIINSNDSEVGCRDDTMPKTRRPKV